MAIARENKMDQLHGELVYEIDGIQVIHCPDVGGVYEVWQPIADGPDDFTYDCVADVEDEEFAIAIADEIWNRGI